MKVTAVNTTLVDLPLPKPMETAIHSMRSVGCVLVEVQTASGAVGEGYVFTLNGKRLKAFDEMIRGLAPLVIGRRVHETEGIWQSVWDEINPIGRKGVTISALSAIDVACWDAVGKITDLPLHHLFGSCREEVATYASSGLWLSASMEELVAEAADFMARGFTAMKLRVGSDDPRDDVARVAAVRDAIGPDVGLMVDANQRFSPKEAIRLGRQLEQFNLIWFEEPVSADDLHGHAQVRVALDTPIASGETEYTRLGIQAMIGAGSADILMPDLQRIGGYTEFRRAAASASSNHLPVSSHIFTEHSLCLAGSIPNCISVEHMDWFAPLFNESMELRNGRLQIPARPGTGFTFKKSVLAGS